MKMKSQLLYVYVVTALVVAATTTTPKTTTTVKTTTTTPKTTTTTSKTTTTSWTTTGTPGLNLDGQMFTLSANGGGICFYPPYLSPPTSTSNPRYTTRRTTTPTTTTRRTTTPTTRPTTTTTRRTTTPTTTTRPTTTTTRRTTTATTTRPTTTPTTTTRPTTTTTRRPWTSAPPTRGVSVCLRYLSDSRSPLFTLDPSSSAPLRLSVSDLGSYTLSFDTFGYNNLFLRTNLKFWSNVWTDLWTGVCLTVDTVRNVAQVFSGSNISIRKMLPVKYVWSGVPMIDFPGFDGQVTDVQIWDYPLRYREVFNYMTNGIYQTYRGSALTWFDISYTSRGNTLLENSYELQGQRPINRSRGSKGRRPKGGKKTWKSVNVGESKSNRL